MEYDLNTPNVLSVPRLIVFFFFRLPFIYCGQEGSHLPPQEVPNLNYARLLEGCIQIVEEDITDS